MSRIMFAIAKSIAGAFRIYCLFIYRPQAGTRHCPSPMASCLLMTWFGRFIVIHRTVEKRQPRNLYADPSSGKIQWCGSGPTAVFSGGLGTMSDNACRGPLMAITLYRGFNGLLSITDGKVLCRVVDGICSLKITTLVGCIPWG